jgi:hypothetical protein
MTDFRTAKILEGIPFGSQAILQSRVIPKLPHRNGAEDWRALVEVCHQNGLRGRGKTLVVTDSGCNDFYEPLRRKIKQRFNLTNEEDGDLNGHGTAVTLLAHQIALHENGFHRPNFDRRYERF